MKIARKQFLCALASALLIAAAITLHPGQMCLAASTIAAFSFDISDGASTAKDLNDTYKTTADSGYRSSSGAADSRLFCSVDGSSSDYRKLEWSKTAEYEYNGKLQYMPIMAAGTKNPWGSAPFFLIKTSTKGYKDINVSFSIGGSKKGPKNYKLQYSTDNKSFSDVKGATFTIANNKTMYSQNFSLTSASSDCSSLYIKIVASSTASIEGGDFTKATTSGETAINNIVISGNAVTTSAKASPTPVPASQKPTSLPSNSQVQTNNQTNNQANRKTLSRPSVTSYKRGSKLIKGKAVKNSTVTVTVKGRTYTAKASKKGIYKVKLTNKLAKGTLIKVRASKKGYNISPIRKVKVK